MILDGKAFRPDGKTTATLIPSAFGLAGVNNHTWTGLWGTVTYWNAFVGNLEMPLATCRRSLPSPGGPCIPLKK